MRLSNYPSNIRKIFAPCGYWTRALSYQSCALYPFDHGANHMLNVNFVYLMLMFCIYNNTFVSDTQLQNFHIRSKTFASGTKLLYKEQNFCIRYITFIEGTKLLYQALNLSNWYETLDFVSFRFVKIKNISFIFVSYYHMSFIGPFRKLSYP